MRIKKIMTSFILIITILFTNVIFVAADTTSVTEFLDGDGSAENPYVIASKTQFLNALKYPDANFLLYTDLTFGHFEMKSFESFSGVFDGNGHKITVSEIFESEPIFGNLSGTVKNLTLDGLFDTAPFASNLRSGGVISHCRNEGKIVPESALNSGGIVVLCSGQIEYSNNAGTVYGQNNAGGIAAFCYGTIKECYNTGEIAYKESTDSNTSNDSSTYLGGIIGTGSDYCKVQDCYNVGLINGMDVYKSYSGGIAGYSYKVINCYNVGRTFGDYRGEIIAPTTKWFDSPDAGSINCYYYKEDFVEGYTFGYTYGKKNPCSYEELCLKETFEGFDFENIWTMGSGDFLLPSLKNNPYINSAEDVSNFAGGSGTAFDPYLISTRAHLNNMVKYPTAYYKIIAETISVGTWIPIFVSSPFYGVLDGNGNTLTDINVNNSSEASLIGECCGIIRNLNISDSTFCAEDNTSDRVYLYAAPFVANLSGRIENCNTIGTGSVNAHYYYKSGTGGVGSHYGNAYAGGIAASGSGEIVNCKNNFEVISNNHAGGIIAEMDGIDRNTASLVQSCVNYAEIKSYYTTTTNTCYSAAGILAYGVNSYKAVVVKDCINYGEISCSNKSTSTYFVYAGGIVGSGNGSVVDSSYNMGNIQGETNINRSWAGGIIGRGNATNCFNNANVYISTICEMYDQKPEFYIGGIAGSGNVQNSYTLGVLWYYTTVAEDKQKYGSFTGYGTETNCYYIDDEIYNNQSINDEYLKEQAYPGFDFTKKWAFDPISGYKYAVPVTTLTEPVSVKIAGDEDVTYETPIDVWPEFTDDVLLYDENGAEYKAPLKAWMLADINLSKTGTYVSDVTYRGISAPQKVNLTVRDKAPVYIKVSTLPDKITYLKDEETFNPDGGVVTIYYDNSSTENIELSEAEIEGFSNAVSGKINLSVSYMGCKTQMEVEITEEVALNIKQLPSKRTYVQSQNLVLDGLIAETVCNKGVVRSVDNADLIVLSDTSVIGKNRVVLKYKNLTATYEIDVNPKEIQSASFVEPSDVVFYRGDEITFKTGYIKVTYVSDDNYTENLPITSDLVKDYDHTLEGYQLIKIYLSEVYNWDLYINVKPPRISHTIEQSAESVVVTFTINKKPAEESFNYFVVLYNDQGAVDGCRMYEDTENILSYPIPSKKEYKFIKLFAINSNLRPCMKPYIIQKQ